MKLSLKRVYDPPEQADGYRILVDRVWPRGLSKEKAAVDEWRKELAPSTELRKWFGHDPTRWEDFKRRYFQELEDPELAETISGLRERARGQKVTLVYAARDERHNNAVALKMFLEEGS